MQHFINQAALERAAAEVFSGAHARTYLLGLLAVVTAAAAGVAVAAIWLGLVLLVEEARKSFAGRLDVLTPPQARAARIALDVCGAASLAAAPAIAWYSGGELGVARAVRA